MIPGISPNGQTSFDLDQPPTRLMVGTAGGIVHLARAGPGAPWREERRSLVGKHIGAIMNAPGGWLFAGCHHRGGLYRSRDDGLNWEAIGPDIQASDIFSLALLDGPDGAIVLVGVEPVSLYRSADLGATWSELPAIGVMPGAEHWTFPPPPHIPHLKSMAINPGEPGSLFACIEQGALLKTVDAGQSWTELDGMWSSQDDVYRDAHRIISIPWNPQLLIFTAGVGAYRSADEGRSWTHLADIAGHIKYPDVLVASSHDRSIFVGGPGDYPIDWLSGDPVGRICRSRDEGLTWQPSGQGLPQKAGGNIEALSIVSYPGGYSLIAGNTAGDVFCSEDCGESWARIASVSPISKGSHFKIAALSTRLPRWLGLVGTFLFTHITRLTGRRAAAKRKTAFAARRI